MQWPSGARRNDRVLEETFWMVALEDRLEGDLEGHLMKSIGGILLNQFAKAASFLELAFLAILAFRHWCCLAKLWKSAVHRSAFINFLQNYAGGRVRQPRTPNTSAARVVTNLIKLNSGSLSCQKKLFHPRLPHADVGLLLFAPDATRSVGETQTQQTKRRKAGNQEDKFPLSVCLMSS